MVTRTARGGVGGFFRVGRNEIYPYRKALPDRHEKKTAAPLGDTAPGSFDTYSFVDP